MDNRAAVGLLSPLLLWVEREPLLRGAAEAWIVSDPVTQADAAVVLGGGIDVRPFAAAELYRKGLVKKVLVSDVEDDRAAAIGAVSGHTEANRRVLLSLGVPATDIENFGSANKSTRDEALALRDMGRPPCSQDVDRSDGNLCGAPRALDVSSRVRRAGCADHCSIIRAAAIHRRALVGKGDRESSPSRTRSSNIFIIG